MTAFADDDLPASLLRVFDLDGTVCYADADDERPLRAAMRHYLETGRDALIDLTMIGGALFTARVSRVASWAVETPEECRRDTALVAAWRKAGTPPAGWQEGT